MRGSFHSLRSDPVQHGGRGRVVLVEELVDLIADGLSDRRGEEGQTIGPLDDLRQGRREGILPLPGEDLLEVRQGDLRKDTFGQGEGSVESHPPFHELLQLLGDLVARRDALAAESNVPGRGDPKRIEGEHTPH
jgi:hypothetical protein